MASTDMHAQAADRRFVKQAMTAPLLEREHEHNLAARWRDHGDQRALHELTTAYMRLVISMAARFRNYGLPMSDLIQEGNVGLMQAAARFEPEREVRFSTYAAWWIRSCIQDYILRNWSIVRTGTTAAQKSLFFNLRRLRALLRDTSDGYMSPESRSYVAKALRVDESDVEHMASRLSASDRSLNAPMSEAGDAEWQDMLQDDTALPEDGAMNERDRATRSVWLREALEELSERELTIIRERRLVEDGVTLETLGQKLGVSKERVRQIEHQALRKLRSSLTRIVGDPEASGLIPST
ncbi:MAG: RNA polymerase factor sigma-32 [Alphaproteobacteria bacterium]|nr:RNA polymerase factor sigma-32 [Alphaproteobacteria bacterium]